MTSCLVIGSNSFSGQDFIDEALSSTDWEIVGVSRQPEKSPLWLSYKNNHRLKDFRFIKADINQHFAAPMPDYVVNFAAQSEVAPSWKNPDHWMQTNGVALASMIKMFLRGTAKRYLHISTPEVYGSTEGEVTETAPYNPSTPYAVSKTAADMLLDVYWREKQFPFVRARAANVYGPRQQLWKIIPKAILCAAAGTRLRLEGGGEQKRSFIDIRSNSRRLLQILQHGRLGETYHISSPSLHSIKEVVSIVAEMSGKRLEDIAQVGPGRPGADRVYHLSTEKADKEFGPLHQIKLFDGIADMIRWFQANMNEIKLYPKEYEHKV
jgi:dTDP-glucose 4,6-dehydratase